MLETRCFNKFCDMYFGQARSGCKAHSIHAVSLCRSFKASDNSVIEEALIEMKKHCKAIEEIADKLVKI